MKSDILVSVIVPVYNVEQYLERCVESILAQTYRNTEIILVDDGARDKSGEICDSLAARDPRVRVIHKENGGLSSARNAGLDVARGDFVSFVDSDDYISPTMLEHMVELMLSHGASVAITGRVDRYESTGEERAHFKKDSVITYQTEEVIRELLLRDKIDVAVCDKMFDRHLFEGIRFPVGENNEDCAVIFRIFDQVPLAVHTDSCDYYYCHRSDSITGTFSVKTIGNMVSHAEAVRDFILSGRPHLADEAKFFLAIPYLEGYRNIARRYKCQKEKEETVRTLYLHLKKQIRAEFGFGKRKKLLNGRQRRFFALVNLGIYDILMRARHLQKRMFRK